MNVSLTPELEAFVQEKVKSGLYQSASEVVRDGLRLLRDEDERLEERRLQVDAKVKRGLAELERGEGINGADARERLRQGALARRRR